MKRVFAIAMLVAVMFTTLSAELSAQQRPEYWREVKVKYGGTENFHGVLYMDLVGKPVFLRDSTACIARVDVVVTSRVNPTTVYDSTAVYRRNKEGGQLELFGVGLLQQLKPEQKKFGPDDIDWMLRRIKSLAIMPKPAGKARKK